MSKPLGMGKEHLNSDEGGRKMSKTLGMRWLVVVAGAAMLMVVAAACGETKTIEVPGETVVVKEEVIKEVQVPGETIVVEKEVVKEVQVPGETVVVEKEVVKTVEVEKVVAGPERIVVEEVVVEGERYTRNIHGKLVEKPQYGGTIAVAIPYGDVRQFDPWDGQNALWSNGLVLEKLGQMDWAIPPDEYDWTQAGYLALNVVTGALAESWEQPDLLTTIFHIRPGVYWHDKRPINGRELTAYDVEFSWHRNLGLGSGFTEPSPYAGSGITGLPLESIEATDKYTLVVKASSFTFNTLDELLYMGFTGSYVQPPEVINEYGDLRDWRHLVGTGPYELTDVVPGSSLTFTRNPNYWQYDPRHPDLELRLPYADQVKYLQLPDLATRLAALLTGKSAFAGGQAIPPTEQVLSLQKTNPELVLVRIARVTKNPGFRVDRPPFDDINVRIAMQKAVNLDEIVRTYYSGNADPTPVGIAPAGARGIYVPYDEWPEETKWKYEYDPEEAERLLDEAGYPRGADGIRLATTWDVVPGRDDLDMAQLAKSYWEKIGVDVNLNSIADSGVRWERMVSGTYGMSECECRSVQWGSPFIMLQGGFHSTKGWEGPSGSVYGVNDPTFEALIDDAIATTDREVFLRLANEADMYHIEQMWSLYVPPAADRFVVHQPWLKAYRGELGSGDNDWFKPIPYLWVDQELKKEMGH